MNKKEPTQAEIEKILYQDAYWFRMPYVYFRILSPISAIVLAFLQREQHFCKRHGAWFRFSVEALSASLYLSDKQQREALREMTSRGYLRIKIMREKGVRGSIRWLKLEEEQIAYVCRPHLLVLEAQMKKSWFLNQADKIQSRLDQVANQPPNEGDQVANQPPNEARKGHLMVLENQPLSPVTRARTHATDKTDKTNTICGDAPHPTPRSGSGLLGLDDKDDTTFGDRCTKRLIKTLLHHRKMMRRPNPKSWAKIFTSLETQLGRKRVHCVLKWYRAHFGEEFVPVAYSAQAFADKFLRIEESMKRTNKRDQAAEPIVPTEEETKVMQDLEILTWPKGAGATLPASVRESLAQYHSWEKVLRRFRTTHRDDHTYCRFIDQLYASMFLSPRSFLLVWYQKIYDKAQNWEGWIPDLVREAWRPTHPEFQRMGRAEASAYFGDSMKWDTFSGRMQALAKDEN